MERDKPPEPTPETTIAGVPVRIMAIENLPPTAVLVVECPVVIGREQVEQIRQALMEVVKVKDVLVFCAGLKLAGVMEEEKE